MKGYTRRDVRDMLVAAAAGAVAAIGAVLVVVDLLT